MRKFLLSLMMVLWSVSPAKAQLHLEAELGVSVVNRSSSSDICQAEEKPANMCSFSSPNASPLASQEEPQGGIFQKTYTYFRRFIAFIAKCNEKYNEPYLYRGTYYFGPDRIWL